MITNRGLLIEDFESRHLKEDIEAFNIGDTVRVHFKIREGKRERIQVFEGIVIALNASKIRRTFTVRKISFNNVAVERVLPLHSPKIAKIDIVRRARVRRAKLYYLRKLRGKAAQVKRLIDNRPKSGNIKTMTPVADYPKSEKAETKSTNNS